MYSLLTLAYIVVFIRLIKSMKRLNSEAVKKEKRSVFTQFALFFLSFFTRLIVIAILMNDDDFKFVETLITIILYMPWNFFVIFYIFYMHYKTYRKMTTMLNSFINHNYANSNESSKAPLS